MSWKFVLNGNYGGYNNEIEVSAVAGKLGYEFSYLVKKCISEIKFHCVFLKLK